MGGNLLEEGKGAERGWNRWFVKEGDNVKGLVLFNITMSIVPLIVGGQEDLRI